MFSTLGASMARFRTTEGSLKMRDRATFFFRFAEELANEFWACKVGGFCICICNWGWGWGWVRDCCYCKLLKRIGCFSQTFLFYSCCCCCCCCRWGGIMKSSLMMLVSLITMLGALMIDDAGKALYLLWDAKKVSYCYSSSFLIMSLFRLFRALVSSVLIVSNSFMRRISFSRGQRRISGVWKSGSWLKIDIGIMRNAHPSETLPTFSFILSFHIIFYYLFI